MSLLELPPTVIEYILKLTDKSTRILFHHSHQLFVIRSLKQAHDNECYNRVLWCLRQGPGYLPAHEHKHLAPGNDRAFFFGIPPWHKDGSVNPAGIPPNYGKPERLQKNWALLDDYKSGWECTKCKEWVAYPPQKFQGGNEPENWWWCLKCREVAVKPKTAAEKKVAKVAATCFKIDTLFHEIKATTVNTPE